MIQGLLQIALTLIIVIATTPLLGKYIAHVFLGQRTVLDKVLNPIERIIYKLIGVTIEDKMTGWQYAKAVLYSNIVMAILVFCIFCSGDLP